MEREEEVEIARALGSQPSFLLLDEPLAGIDPIAVSEINELILQIKQKKVGVLITDRNVRDTLKVVDTAYIIHDGKILKSGSPKEIVADSSVKQVYLGKSLEYKLKGIDLVKKFLEINFDKNNTELRLLISKKSFEDTSEKITKELLKDCRNL